MIKRTPISRHRISGCAARVEFDMPDHLEDDLEDDWTPQPRIGGTAGQHLEQLGVALVVSEQSRATRILPMHGVQNPPPAETL